MLKLNAVPIGANSVAKAQIKLNIVQDVTLQNIAGIK